MSVINTNVNSLVSQAALTKNERTLSSTMQQLSTGTRIGSAKDDAAGLAISSRMSAQIRGLNQAVRNANDGISLLQTAEGATVEMSSMLQRMRELAVQSTNDTNTVADRTYLDLEYQQLTKEIARTGANAEWNGMKLFNNAEVGVTGTANDTGVNTRNVSFQVGANANQTVSVGLKKMTFGTGTAAVESKATINISGAVLTDGERFSFTITDSNAATPAKTFNFTIPTANKLTATPAAADATRIAAAMSDVITNTVGYEGVTVAASGTVISVNDSKGRALSAFTAAKADGTAIATASGAFNSVAAGSVAVGATDDNTSLFTGSTATGTQLNNTSIDTVTNANTAILRVDNAINAVNKERANMGAMMNRLTYASNNLNTMSTNTSASRSRILDTDYASATTELARTQIIQQAATAMLAQANQAPQTVLSLLK